MTATMTTGLERFGSLTLAELNDRAARLTRVDRKYVLDARGAADQFESAMSLPAADPAALRAEFSIEAMRDRTVALYTGIAGRFAA